MDQSTKLGAEGMHRFLQGLRRMALVTRGFYGGLILGRQLGLKADCLAFDPGSNGLKGLSSGEVGIVRLLLQIHTSNGSPLVYLIQANFPLGILSLRAVEQSPANCRDSVG